ncbi:MAG: hypothetical protein ACYSTT_09675 [Planctomycetota bacterium]|jgi:hypothetical protein
MAAQNGKQIDKRISSLLSSVNRGTNEPDKQLLDKLKEQSTAEFLARSTDSSQKSEKTIPISKWRIIMKSPITKLAAAAVIIAALIGISRLGDSIGVTNVAWAKVIETIENAHSITSREKRTLTCEGKELPFLGTSEVMKYASSEYGVREDMYKDGQPMAHTYWLLKANESVNVTPMLKQYKRKPLTEPEKRVLYQMTPDGIANLIKSSEYVELGRKSIDGVDVEGLEIRGSDLVVAPVKLDNVVIRMWVDVESYLPVVIEAEAVTSDKYLTAFTGGKPVKVELLAGEFKWNVELDPKIFEPNIPDDYNMLEE